MIYKAKVLQKYDVSYHQCSSCRFIQTDEPFWLNEAYENAITSLDIGLVNRNLYLQEEIPRIIDHCFPNAKTMLDYGGGYGMFVRMMRDKGYNFFRQDIYCDNLFAKHFDITDHPDMRMDVLTAFEVFEHLVNPMAEMEKMLSYAPNIIFSTVLIPKSTDEFKNWWYLSPQTGQHIAFYSTESLQFMSAKHGLNFYTNNNNLHIFSKEKINEQIIQKLFFPQPGLLQKITGRFTKTQSSKKSLLQPDYEHVLKKISK